MPPMIEKIYIPTVRRANNQVTYENLPKELQSKVIMVIDPAEKDFYNYDCQYLELPESIIGTWAQLAKSRHFIYKHAGNIRYVVTDDDLIIRKRNAKYWTGISNMERSKRNATPEEILEMFVKFDEWLNESSIGIVGPANSDAPPPPKEYSDTKGIFGFQAIDGNMLSQVIDKMDITSIRVAEDVLFMFECLSNGINTRLSTEWMINNKSLSMAELKNTRVVWQEMYSPDNQPQDHFQTDNHYNALKYIQSKFPHAIKIYEKDGRRKNTKYWKRAYQENKNIW